MAVYFESRYKQTLEESGLSLGQIAKSLHISNGEQLNLAGLLLFGRNPQQFRPAFMIKAAYIDGIDIASQNYRDSEDIEGPLLDQYERALFFITRSLHRLQAGQGVNSFGKLEIPEIALQEVLVNALIHPTSFLHQSAFSCLLIGWRLLAPATCPIDREGNQFKVIMQRSER